MVETADDEAGIVYLGVGDEVAHPHTLPTAVGDFHVGHYQPVDGRPMPRLNRMGSRVLVDFRIPWAGQRFEHLRPLLRMIKLHGPNRCWRGFGGFSD